MKKSIDSNGDDRLMRSSMEAKNKLSSPARNVMDNRLNKVNDARPEACRRSRSPEPYKSIRSASKEEMNLYNNRSIAKNSPPRQPQPPKRVTSKERAASKVSDLATLRVNFN